MTKHKCKFYPTDERANINDIKHPHIGIGVFLPCNARKWVCFCGKVKWVEEVEEK